MAETLNRVKNYPPSSLDLRVTNTPEVSDLNIINSSMSQKKGGNYSLSSASSSNSESSDDVEITTPSDECNSLPTGRMDNDPQEKDAQCRKVRSLSDGQTQEINQENEFQVFPSLPTSVLQKLGLTGENTGTALSEQEMEEKFVALALAFSIDASTITDRMERQRRYRDQTETNFTSEIERLVQKVHEIQPLCVDAERAELLTSVLAQTDIVVKASSHATIAAERFGAVQYEHRLAQSAHLMINYVSVLKQQRDSARKQLQYTKRVLQDTNSSDSLDLPNARIPASQLNGGKLITRRRASIATISQSLENKGGTANNTEARKFARRTSDLSGRLTLLSRSSRSSRLELGVDLSKIKEGNGESETVTRQNSEEYQNPETEDEQQNYNEEQIVNKEVHHFKELDTSSFTIPEKIMHSTRKLYYKIQHKYLIWAANGSLHEFFSVGAIICFSLSLIILGNLVIEMEYRQDNRT